jgi:hypothetical protein
MAWTLLKHAHLHDVRLQLSHVTRSHTVPPPARAAAAAAEAARETAFMQCVIVTILLQYLLSN